MTGNVWEWVQDWKGDYPSGNITDPTGPSSGPNRVIRGGAWAMPAHVCRSAVRYGRVSDSGVGRLGFRLVRVN